MARLHTIAATTASAGPETDFGKSRNEFRWSRNFLRVLHAISPRKPAHALSSFTGKSVRQCENIVAERSGLSGDVVRAALNTEHGYEFLAAMLPDPPPHWFQELRYHYEAARLQEQIAEARARHNALKRKR